MDFRLITAQYPVVLAENGCWEWQGTMTLDGYGTIRLRGKSRYAHRMIYEKILGALAPDLVLDHICRNRRCVNPNHLRPMTRRENTAIGDGPTAQNTHKTHCSKGHEYTLENTIYRATGGRRCRVCNNANLSRKNKQGGADTPSPPAAV